MCGIAGIVQFHPESRANEALVRRMTELLAHRGPDDTGIYAAGPVSLGHRRLSIIDLSAGGHPPVGVGARRLPTIDLAGGGPQPMANETGSVWITYNGECYNHRDFVAGLQARGHRFRSGTGSDNPPRHSAEQGAPV